jgi:hypothetical protein
MHENRQRLWFAVCGTSLSLLLAIAGAGAQSTAPNAPAAPAGPKLAEEEFKNIQALKGIPADQVIPSMQFIAASLGVECEFCHVAHANEKDDKKPKVTARKMINMMMAINKDNFEGHREVTCYSCHRGSRDPVATPIITDEEAKLAAEDEKKSGEAKATLPSISPPSAGPMRSRKSRAACRRERLPHSAASIFPSIFTRRLRTGGSRLCISRAETVSLVLMGNRDG